MQNKVTLYIFTHNKTGLKYFGKTTRYFTKETLLKYGGSGKYWNNHLKVHGKDLSVEIYGIYNLDEVEEIALNFSEENNIVNALNESGKKIWANVKPENGLDGGSIFNKGRVYTEQEKRELSKKLTGIKRTKETKELMSKSFLKMTTVRLVENSKVVRITKEEYFKNMYMYKGINKGITFKQETIDKMKNKTITQKHKKAISEIRKTMVKEKSSNKKTIIVYNNQNEKLYTIIGNFKNFCIENNLPFNSLIKTYQNKTKLYESERSRKKVKNTDSEKYIGWYARLEKSTGIIKI